MYKAKSPPRTNAPAIQGFTRALHIETTCLKTIDCAYPRFPPRRAGWRIGSAIVSGVGRDGRIGCDFINPANFGRQPMRLPVLSLLFIGAALLGESIATAAQSAGSYPVCAIYYGIDATGTPSCAFDTRQQCMETISGIGGFCIENQYYRGSTVRPPRRVHVMRKRASIHSSVR